MGDEDRKQVLGEVLMDELKAIREGIADLPTRSEFNKVKDDISELKTDMKVVKAAVTDLSRNQKEDHRYIQVLKQKLA